MPITPRPSIVRPALSRPSTPARALSPQPQEASINNLPSDLAEDQFDRIVSTQTVIGGPVTSYRPPLLSDPLDRLYDAWGLIRRVPEVFEYWVHEPSPWVIRSPHACLLQYDLLPPTELTHEEQQDAICSITREPLEDLTDPVVVRAHRGVHVFSWQALTHWWRTHPNENPLTRESISSEALFRVVGIPASFGIRCPTHLA
jgi:hypothetical protein